jgi:hypothetical protein
VNFYLPFVIWLREAALSGRVAPIFWDSLTVGEIVSPDFDHPSWDGRAR